MHCKQKKTNADKKYAFTSASLENTNNQISQKQSELESKESLVRDVCGEATFTAVLKGCTEHVTECKTYAF